MNKIKYIPTNYFSNKSVIETPWSINSEEIEISGYQPRLRNRILSTQESDDDTMEDSAQDTKQTTYTKPVQETVQAKTVSKQISQDTTKSKNGKVYNNPQDFVEDITAAYTKALAARGISIDYAKMLVAQDALESNWGKSSLAKDFNFGGIKAAKGTPFVEKETEEYDSKKGMRITKAKFRKFDSLDDYVNYKINLLNGKKYQAFIGDPSQFYSRIKAGGYATDPNYVAKLTNVYNNSILSAKQGGSVPSKIDILVAKFNKQFNK